MLARDGQMLEHVCVMAKANISGLMTETAPRALVRSCLPGGCWNSGATRVRRLAPPKVFAYRPWIARRVSCSRAALRVSGAGQADRETSHFDGASCLNPERADVCWISKQSRTR